MFCVVSAELKLQNASKLHERFSYGVSLPPPPCIINVACACGVDTAEWSIDYVHAAERLGCARVTCSL